MAVLSMPRSFDRTHNEDRPCQSRHRHAVAAAERASRHPVGMRSVHHQQPQQENPKQKHASVAKASSGGFRFITVRARGLCKYIIPHLSDVAKLHKEVPTVLKGAPKPNNFKSLMASKMAQLVFPRQALLSRLTASSQFHLEILRTMASIQERRRCVAR